MLTVQFLINAMRCGRHAAEKYVAPLDETCTTYAINTKRRLAPFLAQLGHETESLIFAREIWGPTLTQIGYEARKDLGNTQPGDGHRYLGRGLIQITGRANYAKLRDRLRDRMGPDASIPDFEAEPKALEDAYWAAISAGDYWDMRGLNNVADNGTFEMITRRINGGLNGIADRRRRLVIAQEAIDKHFPGMEP